MTLLIRPAVRLADQEAIWDILEPIIRAGETYPLPQDMTKKAAIAYWLSSLHSSFVATNEQGQILGTYYIRPNQSGRGAHIANCGYMVRSNTEGKGVARTMCAHSIDLAKSTGYSGIQFNYVVSTNTRAIRLWTDMGFETLCKLPGVFDHPTAGKVDALVMFMQLQGD